MQWLGQGLDKPMAGAGQELCSRSQLGALTLGQCEQLLEPLLGLAQEQGTAGNVVGAPEPLKSTLGSSCHRPSGHSDLPRQFSPSR